MFLVCRLYLHLHCVHYNYLFMLLQVKCLEQKMHNDKGKVVHSIVYLFPMKEYDDLNYGFLYQTKILT